MLYLRASNMADRDEWIKSITEAMFMAENVSASFADFRRMRVASAVTRERRGTTSGSLSQAPHRPSGGLVASTMMASPLTDNGASSGQSVALVKARETYRLQQEHLKRMYGSNSMASIGER